MQPDVKIANAAGYRRGMTALFIPTHMKYTGDIVTYYR